MRQRERIKINTKEPDRMRPYDVDRLLCDPSKLKELIGWIPDTELRDGLEYTVAWFKEHGAWMYRHKREN